MSFHNADKISSCLLKWFMAVVIVAADMQTSCLPGMHNNHTVLKRGCVAAHLVEVQGGVIAQGADCSQLYQAVIIPTLNLLLTPQTGTKNNSCWAFPNTPRRFLHPELQTQNPKTLPQVNLSPQAWHCDNSDEDSRRNACLHRRFTWGTEFRFSHVIAKAHTGVQGKVGKSTGADLGRSFFYT